MTPATFDPTSIRPLAEVAGAGAGAAGFVVGEAAYVAFRDAGDLRWRLADVFDGISVDEPGRLMAAAHHARSLVRLAPWPEPLRARIAEARAELVADAGEDRVAVSCLEAFDGAPELPGGEPFVVRGRHALERAIRRCWCSLYEPHRVFLRAERGLSQVDVAIAVAVQPPAGPVLVLPRTACAERGEPSAADSAPAEA